MANQKGKRARKRDDKRECDTDRPSLRVLCEDIDREARKKVPKELQGIESRMELEAFKVNLLSPDDLANVSDEALEAFLPAWEAVRSKPERALRQEGYRPRIRFRGKELAPAVVLGTDERRIYNDRSYPWGCVCKVVTSVGSGSGVLVGPRHVLTASHVVNWSVPGGDRFGWLGTRRYSSSWDDEPYWYNLGYPGDVGGAMWPTWQRSKWLDEHAWDFGSGRAMDTNADINPGNSGGPMFAWWSDGPYVVAVVSAHDVADQENYCAGGSDLVRVVRTARGI